MDKYQCKICGKFITPAINYLSSHVRRAHKIDTTDYCNQYLKNLNPHNENSRKCVVCGDNIIPQIKIDFSDGSFSYDYCGYLCRTLTRYNPIKCKEIISLKILGIPYSKSKYEQIGSMKEFIALKNQISIEDALEFKRISFSTMKRSFPDLNDSEIDKKLSDRKREIELKPGKTNLIDYIRRYGEIEGTIRYNERRKKISYSSTLKFHTEKYGEELGLEKWEGKYSWYKKTLGKSVSAASQKIKILLDNENIKYIVEKPIPIQKGLKKGTAIVDYYIENKNIIIEFFGDYWHCNPKRFSENYYHKILKKTAKEKWEDDKNRLAGIRENMDSNLSILIIWEGSIISQDEIKKYIDDIEGKGLTIFI
jgi:hypothetical protein